MSVAKGQMLIQLDSRDIRADLARTSAELENTKAQFDRMNQLYAQDAVSKQEMENAARAFKIAEANRKAVLAQLSYTMVRAPFNGVITEKMVEAGELASPGQLLLKMENQRQLRLHAAVAERDVNSVSLGDKVSVVIDALGEQTLNGVVSQILPAGDVQTHTFTVKVDLPVERGLKTGMFGRFQINKGTSETILVPWTAVIERGELTSVFAIGSDQLSHLRWVKVGRRFDQQVEILSGVNDGELVLRHAAGGIEGASVTIAHITEIPAVPTPCRVSGQSARPSIARSAFRATSNSL
jgi:RND family efflux transporter MFP subunit